MAKNTFLNFSSHFEKQEIAYSGNMRKHLSIPSRAIDWRVRYENKLYSRKISQIEIIITMS